MGPPCWQRRLVIMFSANDDVQDVTQYPFFVYGTLRRDQENYMLLRGRTVFEQTAFIKNMELYSLKTYPVMVVGEGVVYGELMTLHPRFYQDMIIEFDQLEGYNPHQPTLGLFQRQLLAVHLSEETTIKAWVYIGNKELLMSFRYRVAIPEGDWSEYRIQLIRETRFGRFILSGKSDKNEGK